MIMSIMCIYTLSIYCIEFVGFMLTVTDDIVHFKEIGALKTVKLQSIMGAVLVWLLTVYD